MHKCVVHVSVNVFTFYNREASAHFVVCQVSGLCLMRCWPVNALQASTDDSRLVFVIHMLTRRPSLEHKNHLGQVSYDANLQHGCKVHVCLWLVAVTHPA